MFFAGVYAGDGSHPDVRERLESSDLILSIGAIKSDFNTAGFTYRISQLSTIDFHSNYVRVRYSEYPGVRMQGVLQKVIATMGKLNIQPGPLISNEIADEHQDMSEDQVISHAWFWPRMGQWLEKDDIVITETGTANFGIWETRFPTGVTAISQVLWGSIGRFDEYCLARPRSRSNLTGYALGATSGAAMAAKEIGKQRTVLFIGDGSFQLTVQEVSRILLNLKRLLLALSLTWI